MRNFIIIVFLLCSLVGCKEEKVNSEISDSGALTPSYSGLKCDVCGKEMWDDKLRTALVGIRILLLPNEKYREFYQKQIGKYEVDKEYNICYECWLKSLGVEPKGAL